MRAKYLLWLMLTCLLAGCVSAPAQNDDLHEKRQARSATEIVANLPPEILGFVRGRQRDYEPSAPGGGIGIEYDKAGAYTGTLFVYTANLNPFPTSFSDAGFKQQHNEALTSMLAKAKSRAPAAVSAKSRHTRSQTVQSSLGSRTPVQWDAFIVYVDGKATNDLLFMWLWEGHIWKLRLTRYADYEGDTPVAFVKELLKASGAAKSQ